MFGAKPLTWPIMTFLQAHQGNFNKTNITKKTIDIDKIALQVIPSNFSAILAGGDELNSRIDYTIFLSCDICFFIMEFNSYHNVHIILEGTVRYDKHVFIIINPSNCFELSDMVLDASFERHKCCTVKIIKHLRETQYNMLFGKT